MDYINMKRMIEQCQNIRNSFFHWIRSHNTLYVYSIEETVHKIIRDRCSVIRFGDGDMTTIRGHSVGYQSFENELKQDLLNIAQANSPNLIICIPDVFRSLKQFIPQSKKYWRNYLYNNDKNWKRVFNSSRKYYNAFSFRPYFIFNNKDVVKKQFDEIRSIWENRDLFIIEGEKTRNGVVTDLFDNARTVKRLIAPATNAYQRRKEIIEQAKNTIEHLNNNILILITLGPTAKVVAFELHNIGYQAIDLGQIDKEYKWHLCQAKNKIDVLDEEILLVQQKQHVQKQLEERYRNQIISRLI